MIASISGIRGILNEDLSLADVSAFVANFARGTGSKEFLMARDPRATSSAMSRAVAAALMSLGATIFDYGIVSTPALFRESKRRRLPAVMVTASHNEPQFNGLKFLLKGAGISKELLDVVIDRKKVSSTHFESGTIKPARHPTYVEDLIGVFGEGSCHGIRVAVDLGGGAAISHAVPLLTRLGCDVYPMNDSYGVFNRRIDPVADSLDFLRASVKRKGCDIGLAFDCDGDRLAVVDSAGRKRTGDYMLTLALSAMLEETGEKKIVVSTDTTLAAEDVARKAGAQVFRSKVGEANVVGLMKEHGARLGGEGSSGGMIDGSFNYCRDSVLASSAIIHELKKKGRRFYESVPVYHQERIALGIPKAKALRGIKRLAAEHQDADLTDGFKFAPLKKSWVLIRISGTEDVVRVSAEAETAVEATRLAKAYAKKLKELSR